MCVCLLSVGLGMWMGGRVESKKNASESKSSQVQDMETQSILATNYYTRWSVWGVPPAEKVANIAVNSKIYDVGYIVYSAEFAKKYGLPESHVLDLDEGVKAMEFRVFSDGKSIRSYLNLLLEKDIGLDVPDRSYVMRGSRNGMRMRFP